MSFFFVCLFFDFFQFCEESLRLAVPPQCCEPSWLLKCEAVFHARWWARLQCLLAFHMPKTAAKVCVDLLRNHPWMILFWAGGCNG